MSKINLKLLTGLKIIWAIFVVLVIMLSFFYAFKERTMRVYTEEQLSKTIEKMNAIENKLLNEIQQKEIAFREKAAITQELILKNKMNAILGKDIQEKERQIKAALAVLEQEVERRHQIETQLAISREKINTGIKKIKNLEAKIDDLNKTNKAVELEKIVVTADPAVSIVTGNILVVNKEFGFVVVDLGRKDDLKLGDVLSVYRGTELIGKVQVERLEQEISIASLLPDWRKAEFKENDVVKKM